MQAKPSTRRAVVVVLDGLRADLVASDRFPTLTRLCELGAWTTDGDTVRPSVTAAAMTTLVTGVTPDVHGIGGEGFGVPKDPHNLRLLTRLLAAASQPSSLFTADIPFGYRWLASTLGSLAGIRTFQSSGETAEEILAAARSTLSTQRRGLILMHWPDADRAGHAHGWNSWQYMAAVARLDAVLGQLVDELGMEDESGTLLVACADHGGGGLRERDHDSEHRLDTTIPIILAGSEVRPGPLVGARFVDLPATLLWALGVAVPLEYEGRVLLEAFDRQAAAA